MEVHPHSNVHHSKKWKDYLYEFLMLFLAVSAGFFMENIREHHVESDREVQYMKSLLNDLKADTTNITNIIERNMAWKQNADSLFILMTLPDFSDKTGSIYFFSRKVSLRDFFYMTDGTLNQLNNAGGLRLIRHQDIVDSISTYKNVYDDLDIAQQLKELQLRDYRDACCKVFDVRVYEKMVNGLNVIRPERNPKLISQNPADINELLMRVHYIKRNNAGILGLLEKLKLEATNLQEMIREKYKME